MSETSAVVEKSLRSVFVGNIPYEATEEKLREIFGQAGPVMSFKLMYDRETGNPKGYGFCEYKDQETALSSMRNINGYEIGGRPLRVDNACTEKSRMEMQSLMLGPIVESPYGMDVDPEKAPEAISNAVASLPPEQMYELMRQMKVCVRNNPAEARTLLMTNPQLAYALLQAQVVMRIIDPKTAIQILHGPNETVEPLLPLSAAGPSNSAPDMQNAPNPGKMGAWSKLNGGSNNQQQEQNSPSTMPNQFNNPATRPNMPQMPPPIRHPPGPVPPPNHYPQGPPPLHSQGPPQHLQQGGPHPNSQQGGPPHHQGQAPHIPPQGPPPHMPSQGGPMHGNQGPPQGGPMLGNQGPPQGGPMHGNQGGHMHGNQGPPPPGDFDQREISGARPPMGSDQDMRRAPPRGVPPPRETFPSKTQDFDSRFGRDFDQRDQTRYRDGPNMGDRDLRDMGPDTRDNRERDPRGGRDPRASERDRDYRGGPPQSDMRDPRGRNFPNHDKDFRGGPPLPPSGSGSSQNNSRVQNIPIPSLPANLANQDQEKANLIMQVLQLSDEQIHMLPPEQQASILQLKQQIQRTSQ